MEIWILVSICSPYFEYNEAKVTIKICIIDFQTLT